MELMKRRFDFAQRDDSRNFSEISDTRNFIE